MEACSEGWGRRCYLATSRRCTCKCEGKNHGEHWRQQQQKEDKAAQQQEWPQLVLAI
jgi:hypothetical protein